MAVRCTARPRALRSVYESAGLGSGAAGTGQLYLPGDVATPMLGKQLQQADGSYTLEDVEQAYPLERVGEPLEIAHVICSVLSPFNSFMTGSIIPVDGGLTAK